MSPELTVYSQLSIAFWAFRAADGARRIPAPLKNRPRCGRCESCSCASGCPQDAARPLKFLWRDRSATTFPFGDVPSEPTNSEAWAERDGSRPPKSGVPDFGIKEGRQSCRLSEACLEASGFAQDDGVSAGADRPGAPRWCRAEGRLAHIARRLNGAKAGRAATLRCGRSLRPPPPRRPPASQDGPAPKARPPP